MYWVRGVKQPVREADRPTPSGAHFSMYLDVIVHKACWMCGGRSDGAELQVGCPGSVFPPAVVTAVGTRRVRVRDVQWSSRRREAADTGRASAVVSSRVAFCRQIFRGCPSRCEDAKCGRCTPVYAGAKSVACVLVRCANRRTSPELFRFSFKVFFFVYKELEPLPCSTHMNLGVSDCVCVCDLTSPRLGDLWPVRPPAW